MRAPAERILAALASGDGAQHGDDGDAAAAAPARLPLGARRVVGRVRGRRSQLPHLLLQVALLLEDAVHQPHLHGLFAVTRPWPTPRAGAPRQPPSARHRLLVPVHLVVQVGVHRLALGRAHVAAGELLGGRLVLAHARHVPGDAQLLHRPAQADDARRQAVDGQRGGRQHVDCVRGRGHQVALVVARQQHRQHLLSVGAQAHHGLAQLLGAAPVHAGQPLHLQHHAAQLRILRGQIQEAHEVQVRIRPADAHQRQRGAGAAGQPIIQIQHHHHARGQAQRAVESLDRRTAST